MKRKQKFLSIALCLLLTGACSEESTSVFDPQHHDRVDDKLDLGREDFRQLTNTDSYKKPGGEPGEVLDPSEPPIPEIAEILAAPTPPKIGATKLVSVAVTDDVPLKDVLIELARLADVDIEVDARIKGGVAFRAKDRPFNEVVERIANLAGLRYNMKNGVLRVERDTPYVQTYQLDFLNIERTSNSSMSLSTNVLSSGGGEGGGGGGGGGIVSGSSTAVNSATKSDFWQKFEEGVKAIMAYVPPNYTSDTSIATQPALPAEDGETLAATPVPLASSEEDDASPQADNFYIINQQAGTLTVSGTSKQHELLEKFLEKVRANISAQVLIEAKIVEITLNDQFQSGIDWSQLGGSKVSLPMTFGAVDSADNAATFNFFTQDIAGLNIDLQAAVDLAQVFGTTRTLSSPRLHAINNQQAVLTFAENQVYFELEIERESNTSTGGTTSDLTVTSTLKTVPIGIILTLQPSINTDTSEVTLSVRPTLSRVTGVVNDPAVAFLITQLPAGTPTAGLISQIPVVEVRELDSILKLQSGQVMVIGGLMEDKSNNTERGIPWLNEVPYVGAAFKGVDKDRDVKELVIFIRATIVGSHGNVHPTDKAVYDKFTRDPRPLPF